MVRRPSKGSELLVPPGVPVNGKLRGFRPPTSDASGGLSGSLSKGMSANVSGCIAEGPSWNVTRHARDMPGGMPCDVPGVLPWDVPCALSGSTGLLWVSGLSPLHL